MTVEARGVRGGRVLFIRGLHHTAPHFTKIRVVFVVRQKLLPRLGILATYGRAGT